MARAAAGEADVAAEHALLAGILLDPEDGRSQVGEVLSEDLFTAHRRDVARSILSRWREGRPVDPVLVAGDMSDAGANGAARLPIDLVRSVGTAGNLSHYVKRLEEVRERRGVEGKPTVRSGILTMRDLLDAELGRVEKGVARLATGFARFDAALGGGLVAPGLHVIGAGPKSLKSTWCQVVAERHAAGGGAVYYLDLENGATRFLRRLLCRRAGLGMREVATALESPGSPVFQTRDAAERWKAAQVLAADLPILLRFRPPDDLVADLEDARRMAGDRTLAVVVDSLQKLPGDLAERRATVDGWVRLLERLRLDLNLVVLLVSEIRRGREGYAPREDAFKESSGVEYGADTAFTLSRAAADEDGDETSTLRIELARDCEEDPRGDVASYRPARPHYGIEEIDPEPRKQGRKRHGPAPERSTAAREWLEARLGAGPAKVEDIRREGEAAGHSRTRLVEARKELGAVSCTLTLAPAWRLP